MRFMDSLKSKLSQDLKTAVLKLFIISGYKIILAYFMIDFSILWSFVQ